MFTLTLLTIILTLMLGLFSITFAVLPPEVPIYYSHGWGEPQLGSKWELFLIPIIMVSFYIALNYFKKHSVKSGNELLASIFAFANVSQIIFLCFVFVRIIFIVIW